MKTTEEFTAEVSRQRYLFYKSHPDVAPQCEANDNIVIDFARTKVLSLEDKSTWDAAYEANKGSFAPNRYGEPVAKPEAAPAPAPAPEPVLEGQELLRKLRKDMRSENPAVVFEAEDQLKRIQAGPRLEKDSDLSYLARLYAPAGLRNLPELHITWLRKRYGAGVVSAAINLNQASSRY
jgi:hypothetical protein